MNDFVKRLTEILRGACTEERFAWVQQARDKIRNSDDAANELANLSAMARRKMGDTQLATDIGAIDTTAGPLFLENWSAADVGRALLSLRAIEVSDDKGHAAINLLFRHGYEAERSTVARAHTLGRRDGCAMAASAASPAAWLASAPLAQPSLLATECQSVGALLRSRCELRRAGGRGWNPAPTTSGPG